MSYDNNHSTALIECKKKVSNDMIKDVKVESLNSNINNFVNKFSNPLIGYTVLFSGISVEEANAAGVY